MTLASPLLLIVYALGVSKDLDSAILVDSKGGQRWAVASAESAAAPEMSSDMREKLQSMPPEFMSAMHDPKKVAAMEQMVVSSAEDINEHRDIDPDLAELMDDEGCEGEEKGKGLRKACRRVAEEGEEAQAPARKCPHMKINGESFATALDGRDAEKLDPFFTKPENAHFFEADAQLRQKYRVKPTEFGCGVVATEGYKKGDLIGLAAIFSKTKVNDTGFEAYEMSQTPWLGMTVNHCPDEDSVTDTATERHANAASALMKDHKPDTVFFYAAEPIKAGEEITVDYNRLTADYPDIFEPAKEDWKCMKDKHNKHEDKALRAEPDE